MIFVTGSLAFDYIMDFPGKISDQIVPDKIHNISLSFLVDKLQEERGGTAGNIAYSLSLLKAKSSILACAGRDFALYKKFLSKNGIETKYIKIIKNDYSARAYITTDVNHNQITGFYPGALRNDSNLTLPKLDKNTDFVIIAPTDPTAMGNYINFCTKFNIPFMFDPGMQLPRISIDDLRKGMRMSRILVGNDYEMALIKKKLNINNLQPHGSQILITTLGKEGCEIITIKQKYRVPAAKLDKVLDPTGAGDAFRAGFVAGYIRSLPLESCGRMGCLVAVYAIEKYGTTNHKFNLNEFKKRYKENYNDTLRY
ncbi:carbohydrate kinase family protein [Candidatus Gottesmanbacteria bacterium]|nr:carbohydrate kinase family protein [Candidatus Gottesmanbacteria bacterium]